MNAPILSAAFVYKFGLQKLQKEENLALACDNWNKFSPLLLVLQ